MGGGDGGLLEVRILGPLEVVCGGRSVPLGAAKERALLTMLALEPGKVLAADRLVDELWAGRPPESAAASLRVLVSRLRRGLGTVGAAERLVTRAPGYLLDIDAACVDVARFELLAARGREELSRGEVHAAATTLRDALGLWRGSPLADAADCPAAASEAGRLEEARLSVLEDRVEADLAEGRHGVLVGELDSLVRAHPFRESLWAARMLSLYRCGRQADALAAFTELRERLVDELGIDPSPQLRELQGRILAQDPGLGGDTGAASAGARPPRAEHGARDRAALVTFLFTDLVGSTELLQKLGDDAGEAVRRTHFRLLREAVRSRGGEEVKNLGDGLMVAFDSAVEAVGCAVAIQQAVHRHGQRGPSEPFEVRVGLNVGEPIRDEDDYFGTPVVVAKRLCDAAHGGQILVSGLVAGLVGSRGGFEFQSLGDLALKGISEPLAASEVAWEPASAQPIPLPPAIAAEARTAFVGRGEVLERMRAEWERACAGERRLLLLGGEPGIGKTRLASEFCRAVQAEGATVMAGRSYEETLIPYQPFVEALRRYCSTCPVDELRAELGAQGGELQRLVPELAQLIPELSPPLSGEPDGERYRLFESVASLLTEASASRPVVLLLDDLHWGDTPTGLLLKHVLRAPGRSSVLVVGTYREPELAASDLLMDALTDLRRDHLVERIAIKGLREDDVAELLAGIAGQEAPRDLARAIFEETEGNPFFVEELARHLAETGAVYRKDGEWTTDVSVAEMGIPEGVKEVIGSRISRLDDHVASVLTTAAVLGREFGLDILRELTEFDHDELAELLEPALAAQLVEEEPGMIGRYRFTHALIRETLYQQLSATRRTGLHRRVGEGLERLHPSDRTPHLAELAQHFFEAAAGGDATKAIEYSKLAGVAASSQLAYEEATLHFERALQLLGSDGDVRDLERGELLLELGEASWRSGDAERALAAFRAAAELARAHNEPELLARAALGAGLGMGGAGFVDHTDQALAALLEEALQALPEVDGVLRVRLLSRLAVELYFTDLIERRDELSREAVEMAQRINDPRARMVALYSRHWAMLGPDLGIEERLGLGDEILELSSQLEDREMACRGHHIRLRALQEMGHMAAVDEEIEAHAALARELREPFYVWQAAMLRTMLTLHSGRLDAAERMAVETFEIGKDVAPEVARTAFAGHLVAHRLMSGRAAEIVVQVEQAAADMPQMRGAWDAGLTYVFGDMGREPDMRAKFEHYAADGFRSIPRDGNWLLGIYAMSVACRRLRAREHAKTLYELMLPLADRLVVPGTGSVTLWSCAGALGATAAALGRWDTAIAHYEAAVADERQARPWAIATARDYAEALLERDAPGDRDRAAELVDEALAKADVIGIPAVVDQLARLQEQLTSRAL